MGVPTVEVTPDLIAAVAGIVLTLIFSYFPKLNTWFAALEKGTKQAIMAGVLILVTGVLFGLGCASLITIPDFTCDRATLVQYLWMLIWAIVANQGVYKLLPQTRAVRTAKATRDTI